MNYIIINGELYHHGIKGMKWGVRRQKKKEERAARKAQKESNLTDDQKKKRQNTKKAAIIGGSVVAAGLAVYGGIKLKKYLDNKRRVKAGEEFARRVQYEFEKRMFEQRQMRDAARATQRKIEQQATNDYLNGLGDRLMDTFRQQNGFS